MNETALRRLILESDLRQAIENNELSIHYQPQIDIVSQRVCSMEALLRWNSAELGAISPSDFIPIAEETGFILSIGDWVMRAGRALAVSRLPIDTSGGQRFRAAVHIRRLCAPRRANTWRKQAERGSARN